MAAWPIKVLGGVGVRLCSSPETAGKSLRTVISEPPILRSQAWVLSKKRGKILHFGKISCFLGKYVFLSCINFMLLIKYK